MDKAEIDIAIGAIDFSFNEDRNERYAPFWSPHYYLITSVANKKKLLNALREIYRRDGKRISKPVCTAPFENTAYRRSYVFKIVFDRRIGKDDERNDGTTRKCRNTDHDRLRAAERLELFRHVHQIGFAARFIFRSAKPIIKSTKVKIREL